MMFGECPSESLLLEGIALIVLLKEQMDSAPFGGCLGINFPSLTPDPPNGCSGNGSRSPCFSKPSVSSVHFET